ncbi:GTP-binding protein [Haloferula helveola]|uniref:GTP-binding protein n=1 Tax=Haloferula helveola TaxID=490095 RepID=A0ABM7RCD8_9BACT|nr:GTP-binding protein [Haloferula helveola]
MNDWWNDKVPSFVVVGRVNAGKSATLATLLEVDDDEILRVSSTPGETTSVQALPVVYDDEEWIRFYDSPGFQQPVEAMREIERMAGDGTPGPDEVRRFVEECGDRYPDEVRLLEPIVRGAGILYVVDPSKPLRDSFIAEIEILRWSGRPRLALLNPQTEDTAHEQVWRERLGTSFNLVRTFDAHQAKYDERRKLLLALLQIEERQSDRIEHVLEAMEREWGQRREDAAEALVDFLEKALTLRTSDGLDERDLGVPTRRERKQEALVEEYFTKLAKLESDCLGRWLKIYRHHLLQADTDPALHRGLDLSADEAWRKYGLNRSQLTAAGAGIGAATGGLIDVGVGGHSFGIGLAIGALVGGSAAFLQGGKLPELKVSGLGGIRLRKGGGRSIVVGPPKEINFPWVLLDSMLVRYRGLLSCAHGRRDADMGPSADDGSIVREFESDRRSLLQKWFTSCLKGSPDRGREPEVFAALLEALEEVGEK